MAVQVCDDGRLLLVEYTILVGNAWMLRLFQNDVTPNNETEWADLDEADFDGYAAVALTVDASGLDDPNNRGFIRWEEETFVKLAGATDNIIFGWYVTGNNSGSGTSQRMVMAERFSPPLLMITAGDEIPVQPELRLVP